jgi:hypothetical protein
MAAQNPVVRQIVLAAVNLDGLRAEQRGANCICAAMVLGPAYACTQGNLLGPLQKMRIARLLQDRALCFAQ